MRRTRRIIRNIGRELMIVVAIVVILAAICVSASTINADTESTETVTVTGRELTPELMTDLGRYMDPDVLSDVQNELGSATAEEYVVAYLEADPSFGEVLDLAGVYVVQ